METAFTPLSALAGGVLIGLSAVLLLLANGRIAGISGIVGGLLSPNRQDLPWQLAFVVGLLAGPLLVLLVSGSTPVVTVTRSTDALIAAGLLVGYGTRLGNGCTSGHGVCGMARLSPRSLAATGIFLVAALATVFVSRHLLHLL